jgi:hypothetical protein
MIEKQTNEMDEFRDERFSATTNRSNKEGKVAAMGRVALRQRAKNEKRNGQRTWDSATDPAD